LASAAFADPERASNFLRFVVERKLEGRAGELKEFVIDRRGFRAHLVV
jgi:hypothetical protein